MCAFLHLITAPHLSASYIGGTYHGPTVDTFTCTLHLMSPPDTNSSAVASRTQAPPHAFGVFTVGTVCINGSKQQRRSIWLSHLSTARCTTILGNAGNPSSPRLLQSLSSMRIHSTYMKYNITYTVSRKTEQSMFLGYFRGAVTNVYLHAVDRAYTLFYWERWFGMGLHVGSSSPRKKNEIVIYTYIAPEIQYRTTKRKGHISVNFSELFTISR